MTDPGIQFYSGAPGIGCPTGDGRDGRESPTRLGSVIKSTRSPAKRPLSHSWSSSVVIM